MITDFEVFYTEYGKEYSKNYEELMSKDTDTNKVPNHLFVKHYLFSVIKQATEVQYTDKKKTTNDLLNKLVSERFDRLLFHQARLLPIVFEYNKDNRFVVSVHSRANDKKAVSAVADSVANSAIRRLLKRKVLQSTIDNINLCEKHDGSTLLPIDSALHLYGLTRLTLYLSMGLWHRVFSDSMNFNTQYERTFADKLLAVIKEQDDGAPAMVLKTYIPPKLLTKVFLNFNTLFADDYDKTKEQTEESPAEPPAEQTEQTEQTAEQTEQTAEPPAEQTEEEAKRARIKALMKQRREAAKASQTASSTTDIAAEVAPAVPAVLNVHIDRAPLPSRKGANEAMARYEFSLVAQGLMDYAVGAAKPECEKLMQQGEITMPTQFFIEMKPRVILRAMGLEPTTERVNALHDAVKTLFEIPLKYRAARIYNGKKQMFVDCFHLISWYSVDEKEKVVVFQISPELMTPNHPVNAAFRQYRTTNEFMAGHDYSVALNCTDVDMVINSLMLKFKPGEVICWDTDVFGVFKFKDGRDRRKKQQILDGFDKRFFDTYPVDLGKDQKTRKRWSEERKVGKYGFIYVAKDGKNYVPKTKTAVKKPRRKKKTSTAKTSGQK